MFIESAEYVSDYKLRLKFNNKRVRVVDFAPFLNQSTNPLIRRYLELDLFKVFNLTHGDLEWNDYDLCFPIADLYANDLLHSTTKDKATAKHRKASPRRQPTDRTLKAPRRTRAKTA